MESVRVLLIGLPGVLRDIVQGVLEEQPDIVVVDDVARPEDLAEALTRAGADLVIWVVDGEDPFDRHTSLFEGHPRLKVIAIQHGGRQGYLWQLRPHRTVLGEVSPPQLVAAIRQAVQH